MYPNIYKYFVYRHIRLDKNEVFYIGRGKTYVKEKYKTKSSIVGLYWRAFCKNNRHPFWKSVTAKTDFAVEIIFESNDFDFICEKEQEFIKLYGRKDLGTGTLVNMSDGGDGGHELSKYSVNLIKKTNKERGYYDRYREERSLPVYVYSSNGLFLKSCKDKFECAKYIGCSPFSINTYLYHKTSINDCFLSREHKVNGIDTSPFRICRPKNAVIEKIVDGDVVASYTGFRVAAKAESSYTTSITRSIKTGKPVKGVLWRKRELGYKINKEC